MLKNTRNRYGSVAKSLHWLMAVLIIGLLCVGLYMTGMPNGLDKLQLYGLHKSFGLVALMLVIIRLSWKLANVAPLLPDSLSPLNKFAAHAGHAFLYVCAFVMPLSGWALSSSAGVPVSFFNWFVVPELIAPNNDTRLLMKLVHEYTAYGLILLICGHVGAVVLHYVVHKENILKRMLFVRE